MRACQPGAASAAGPVAPHNGGPHLACPARSAGGGALYNRRGRGHAGEGREPIDLKIGADDRIEGISFEGEGCTISQAGASVVTELVMGKPLGEIEEMDLNAIIDELGRDVVISRTRCATLGLGTVKGAIAEYRRQQERAAAGRLSEASAGGEGGRR
jgi:hypothetical protein